MLLWLTHVIESNCCMYCLGCFYDFLCVAGTGYVCSTYLGSTPYSIDIVRIFNLSNEICKR